MHLPRLRSLTFLFLLFAIHYRLTAEEACPRPEIGSSVAEPSDFYSKNGVLKVDLEYRGSVNNGQNRYCFVAKDSSQAPTLHVKPGDQLILTLKNTLPASTDTHTMKMAGHASCTNNMMTSASANLHFHGLVIAPVCHQDDTLNTFVQPSDPPYEYRFTIPKDQPPGAE